MPLTTFLADYGVLLVITIQTIIFGILYWKQNKIMKNQVSLMKRGELRRIAFYTVAYLDYVRSLLFLPDLFPRDIYNLIQNPRCISIDEGWEYFKKYISKLYDKKEASVLEDLILELKKKYYDREDLPDEFKNKMNAQLDKIINYLVYTFDISPDYKWRLKCTF